MTSEAERKSVRERVNKPPRLIKKAIKQEKDKHCEIDRNIYQIRPVTDYPCR